MSRLVSWSLSEVSKLMSEWVREGVDDTYSIYGGGGGDLGWGMG